MISILESNDLQINKIELERFFWHFPLWFSERDAHAQFSRPEHLIRPRELCVCGVTEDDDNNNELRMDGMENSEKWSDNDVQALLALYATEEVQSGLEGCTRNLKIFGKIARELAQIGVYHTAKQCREKSSDNLNTVAAPPLLLDRSHKFPLASAGANANVKTVWGKFRGRIVPIRFGY